MQFAHALNLLDIRVKYRATYSIVNRSIQVTVKDNVFVLQYDVQIKKIKIIFQYAITSKCILCMP